jgi:integrase
MGTIIKRGERYQVKIRKKGYDPVSGTFRTRREAEAWMIEQEAAMNAGTFTPLGEARTTTLREALDRYESEITPRKKGAVQEKSVLRKLREWKVAARPLATIRSADVAAWRDQQKKYYAPKTIANEMGTLSHVFNIARREWGMEGLRNPVDNVEKPVVRNARTRRIEALEHTDEDRARGATQDELATIKQETSSETLPAIITLAVETAARRGELIKLRWEDVDLKNRTVFLGDTKNGEDREVPLSPTAIETLRTLPRNLNGKVFDVTRDSVTRAFTRARDRARDAYVKACKDLGKQPSPSYLVDLHFHDLRHEATTRLASIFPMHELAKITGHKDPRMLMRYYHPKASDLALKLERALASM